MVDSRARRIYDGALRCLRCLFAAWRSRLRRVLAGRFRVPAMDGQLNKNTAQSPLSAKMIIVQANLPHFIFSLAETLFAALRFLIVLFLLIIFVVIYTGQASWAYLAIPGLLVLNLLFIFQLGLLLSCIVPFFPDSRKIIDNLFQLLFFCSGIFFDISQLERTSAELLYLNPIAALLSCYRMILLDGHLPAIELLYSPMVATAMLTATASVFYLAVRHQLPKALLRR